MVVDVVIHGADEVKLLCSLHEVVVTFEVVVNYVMMIIVLNEHDREINIRKETRHLL